MLHCLASSRYFLLFERQEKNVLKVKLQKE